MDEKLRTTAQEKEELEDDSVQLQTKLHDVWKDLDNVRRENQVNYLSNDSYSNTNIFNTSFNTLSHI